MAKYAGFASLAKRLDTFNAFGWLKPRPFGETLAAHGFFYIGSRDVVQCFQCGVTIHTWLDSDDVAVEHFRHSPTCQLASKAMNLSPQSKILLTEMLKKINLLTNELAVLRRRGEVENDSCFRLDEGTVR